MLEGSHRWVVTGHSHFPGHVQIAEERIYINTGSWTFNSSQYALWDGEKFEVRDWITQKVYTDRAYQPLIERRFKHMGFLEWWRENYMGWLRYRVGEVGRIKQPS